MTAQTLTMKCEEIAFSDRLRILLGQRTQAWLMRMSGLSSAMVSRLINGSRSPTHYNATQLAAAFEMPLVDLLNGTNAVGKALVPLRTVVIGDDEIRPGVTVHKWTVVEAERAIGPSRTYLGWRCRCVCGTIRVLQHANIVRGKSQSCGCTDRTRHGHRRRGHTSSTYITWRNMIRRCVNTSDRDYADYGGRGITVCTRWSGTEGFANFLSDMGERPDGLTIDRKDNDGDYTPDNCRWATFVQQANNRRNTKLHMEDIVEIRRLLAQRRSQQSIADRFGVCQVLISDIKLGKCHAGQGEPDSATTLTEIVPSAPGVP